MIKSTWCDRPVFESGFASIRIFKSHVKRTTKQYFADRKLAKTQSDHAAAAVAHGTSLLKALNCFRPDQDYITAVIGKCNSLKEICSAVTVGQEK